MSIGAGESMAHETPPHWDRDTRQRLQRGEAAALGELYDRFASLAYSIAQRVLGDEDATCAVTQEVFTRLWESPDDFDPAQGPMRSWIAAEAHRRAVDQKRRCGAAGAGPPEPGGAQEEMAPWEEKVRAASTAARADYIVTAMPEPLRDALELARFERHDYRQLATRLEISQDEACRRLRLGLQLLSTATRYRTGEFL